MYFKPYFYDSYNIEDEDWTFDDEDYDFETMEELQNERNKAIDELNEKIKNRRKNYEGYCFLTDDEYIAIDYAISSDQGGSG